MATQTTRWSPDTCPCSHEYTWDDTEPAATRTHTFARTVRKCPAHAALSDRNAYTAVTDENPRKNRAIARMMDDNPTLFPTPAELMLATGSTQAQVDALERSIPSIKQRDFDGQWEFDANRDLVLALPARISTLDRTRIQTELRARVSAKLRVV